MIALLKKDWRLFHVPMVGTVIFIALCYLIFAVNIWLGREQLGAESVASELATASVMGLNVVGIMAAVFGGVAFAFERHERWADFMAMLPVSRFQIVVSKIIVAGTFLSLISVVLGEAFALFAEQTVPISPLLHGVALYASCVFMSFSVAWLCSSFLSSPAISAAISLALVVFTVICPDLLPPKLTKVEVEELEIAVMGVAGIVSFLTGTIYYLLRVEP
jgi:ABC-type transport system involved in multi-copper enzyme maturation permease subunit